MSMHVKEVSSEGLFHSFEITVELSAIEKEVSTKLSEYAKTLKLPGFRPGKVPMPLLKQRYGRAVLGEVLEKVVNDNTAKALEERKIRPALQPKIEVKEFEEGKDLVYSLSVESLPEFEVMDLKSIAIDRPVAEVEDKEIDAALSRIASQNRDSKTVDRAAQAGDSVKIDFHGRTADDNKAHSGMHGHDHMLELGSKQFIEGFEDQLIGAKAGERVEVRVTFPSNYAAKDLAGRDAIFEVDVKEVCESSDSELNDEFAGKLGFENLEALRNAIRDMIRKEYDNMSRMKVKRNLLDKLDAGHIFPLPQGMVDLEFENIKRQIEMERQQEPGESQKDFAESELSELKDIAARRVRLGLVLAQIGTANNIRVGNQDLQMAVFREASRFPGQEKEVFNFYTKNPQALESLRVPLFEDKVVDYILELAAVTDVKVSAEELAKDDDAEAHDHVHDEQCGDDHAHEDKGTEKSKAKKSSSKKKTETSEE